MTRKKRILSQFYPCVKKREQEVESFLFKPQGLQSSHEIVYLLLLGLLDGLQLSISMEPKPRESLFPKVPHSQPVVEPAMGPTSLEAYLSIYSIDYLSTRLTSIL